MKLSDLLQNINRLFLDSAPIIYYIETDQRYLTRVDVVFDRLDAHAFNAVTSPITLAECLIMPLRHQQMALQLAFQTVILNSANIQFIPINALIAQSAADLRARYNLALPDALQVATALHAQCDAFLTNDRALNRITELNIIVLDDVEP